MLEHESTQCTMDMFPLKVGFRIYFDKSVSQQLSLSLVLFAQDGDFTKSYT